MSNGKVMETVVKLAGSIDPSLAKSVQEAQKQLGTMNKTAFTAKAGMVAFGVAAVTATYKIGKQLYELGAQFDKSYDAIRIGTGATGEALDNLKTDFKAVYSSVPGSMEDASKAIADYNTRLGLTGNELQGLSKQAITVSGMLGEDLNSTIESSSKAFQQWGINSQDMGNKMDYIFKVSQSTGTGFNELMANMKQFGPQLQNMGYSFEQASALMGQMDKAGVNTTEVLAAMKKSVTTLAKKGISATDGMKMYYEQIKNAGNEAKAASIASEVFGARAGSTMANAIRKGTLNVEAFTKSLESNSETIMGAMWDTADAAERWEIIQHQLQVAFEPFASAVFDFVNSLLPILTKIIQLLIPAITFLAEHMNALIPIIVAVASSFGSFSVIQSVVGMMNVLKASTIATTLANGGLLASLQAVWVAMTTNPIGWIAIAIGALIGVIVACVIHWEEIKNAFIRFWDVCKVGMEQIKNGAIQLWQNIKTSFGAMGNFIKEHFVDILLFALGPLGQIITAVRLLKNGLSALKSGGKNKSIPALASGGFTQGLSFAGEAGTEAVISFDSAYRANNISTWMKAGQMLGVSDSNGSNSYNLGGFSFSPNIYITESMSSDDVINKLKSAEGEFCDMIDSWMERKTAGSYKSASFSY